MAPGVIVSTSARSGPSSSVSDPSGQFFVVGLADRGSATEATLIRGLADFESKFGGRTSYSSLYDVVKSFFEEGGEQAYVARVVGDAAASGTTSIDDRATPTPVETLTATAASEGAWSADVEVEVIEGTFADTVKVVVRYGGTIVESYDNLASPARVAEVFSKSPYVRFTNAGSVTAAPGNLPAVGTYTLSAGADDRAAVGLTEYTAALAKFVEGYGDGAVAIPGVGVTVHEAIINHCIENNRIALLSLASAIASADDYTSAAGSLNTEYAGLFGPWVQMSDGAGGTRNVPPEGYVAGVRTRAHEQEGAWRTPAGGIAVANNLVGLSTDFTKDEANTLDSAKVSVIRKIGNTVRLYGWRSLSNDVANYGYLNARDLLNRLVVESESALEDYLFAPVDGKGMLLSAINAELVGIVEPIRQAGGLYENIQDGEIIDPGYLVETGNTVNTTESLANNEVRARLSIRMSPVGALITLTIVKVGLTSGL